MEQEQNLPGPMIHDEVLESGILITRDRILRFLFHHTKLGDEMIKATLPDIKAFDDTGKGQKVLENTSYHYVIFDFSRPRRNTLSILKSNIVRIPT